MKRWLKKSLLAGCVIALGLCITPLLTRNQTTTAAAALDYVNPLVAETTVYVSPRTSSVQWHANNHGGMDYSYHVTSFDAQGHARAIVLHATDAPLETTGYLAVSTKGQTVLQWRHINAKQVPPAALHQISRTQQ